MPRPTDLSALGAYEAAAEAQWDTIFDMQMGALEALASGATHYLPKAAGTVPLTAGTDWAANSPQMFYFDPAEHAVPDRQTQLRVKATISQNGTQATTPTFTLGLAPLTVSGGAGLYLLSTTGHVGNTVAFDDPAINAFATQNGAAFDATNFAAGLYTVSLLIGVGAIDASASLQLTGRVQRRTLPV